ncbi:MAG: hypothetical protein QG673_1877 [Pseudomonadota bacterium]|nr:hypothetical protein [Pseudomonadota bacterium]
MKKLIIVLLGGVILVGCSKPRTMEYYMQHEKEGLAKQKECEKLANPFADPECVSAVDAIAKIQRDKMADSMIKMKM